MYITDIQYFIKSARNLVELEPAVFKNIAGSFHAYNQELTTLFFYVEMGK